MGKVRKKVSGRPHSRASYHDEKNRDACRGNSEFKAPYSSAPFFLPVEICGVLTVISRLGVFARGVQRFRGIRAQIQQQIPAPPSYCLAYLSNDVISFTMLESALGTGSCFVSGHEEGSPMRSTD